MGLLKNLPDDLRKMDERQFVKLVEWLKEKTNNFTHFPEELLILNNQLILILRIALGMTRPVFARKVGINQTTLRFVEAGRRQNQIKSLIVAKRWCEKINTFLESNQIEVDLNKALVLFREFSRKQDKKVGGREKVIEKIKKLNLPGNLIKMNEKQLESLFKFLKKETDNFTEIPSNLLVANSKLFIFSFRCLLGFTQKELALNLGMNKDWIRHLENGREKILHLGPALRWIPKLERLLKGKDVSFDEFLANFKMLTLRKNEKKVDRQSFRHISEEEFLHQFRELKEKSENFTKLTGLIFEDPRRIFILRVMLLLQVKRFSEAVGVDKDSITRWESGKGRINWKLAKKISEFCQKLVSNLKLDEDTLIERLKIIRNRVNPDRERVKKNAFKAVESLPPNGLEKRITKALSNASIPFKLHATLKTKKVMMNVDFAIPDDKKPKAVIEVFATNPERFSNSLMKACLVDHRFQHIKETDRKTLTIMVVEFKGRVLSHRKEEMKEWLLNTDVFVEANEIERLKENLTHMTHLYPSTTTPALGANKTCWNWGCIFDHTNF